MSRVGLTCAAVLCAALGMAVVGCGSPHAAVPPMLPGASRGTSTTTAADEIPSAKTVAAATSVAPARSAPDKALVIIEENRTEGAALAGMPYLASLAASFGQTSDYQAVAHPSLPNYLALIGGSTFDVADDQPPADHPISGVSVLDRAIAASTTAKAYLEDMPSPCALTPTGDYAVKHNPWAYFTDQGARRNCQSFDLPAGTTTDGALHDDVESGTLPTIGMLVPNLCHDAHNCSLGAADDWLRQWLPILMHGPDYLGGHLAIVITFDEDDSSGGNTVLTAVIAPGVQHISSAAPLSHYSVARYLAEIAAVPVPGLAATAPSLATAFGM